MLSHQKTASEIARECLDSLEHARRALEGKPQDRPDKLPDFMEDLMSGKFDQPRRS